ncbi:BREX-3 system P-loop-containing protein BrxF [Bacillus sp. DNRA2]|uniref:BREX-3 system P-loop-containing protein BrxF n=1 Tax=Bacillus sp. DNRA2 TaxID=2723053 RepID=UPI00145E7E9F|nr:BREX-3 system P-loop-containing protein BrxF [Bacillus sp. DNRA2]NMD71289.1 BREX-3 system P-loop-containing protein BrxF [Bacillus sp. DNRA2]
MSADLVKKIEQELEGISTRYYKMILVCELSKGTAVKKAAESFGIPLLNISMLLSEKLKEYPSKRMAGRVHSLLSDILRNAGSSTLCLEHIEVLFDPTLKQDVIQLLQPLSRNYTLVVSWKGSYDGRRFVYAVPGHPEYYECKEFDGIIVTE